MSEQWDASNYVPSSNLQQYLAKLVLEKYKLIQPTDYLLDLGCGPGNITAELATKLVDGKILGVDASKNMIEHAKNAHKDIENLSFDVVDAEHLNFKSVFDGVVSFTMLHWAKNQVAVLKNVYNALKFHGYFFGYLFTYASYVLIPLSLLMEHDKWKKYFSDCGQEYYYHDINGYEILLKQAGFEILHIDAPLLKLTWDREYFIKTQSSWLPQLTYLPKQLKATFLEELADEFERFHPKLEDGTFLGPLRIITFSAKKL